MSGTILKFTYINSFILILKNTKFGAIIPPPSYFVAKETEAHGHFLRPHH